MQAQIRDYVDLIDRTRAEIARCHPGDPLAIRLKKRFVGSPVLRYQVRVSVTHMLEPYSRRRAQRIAATARPLRLNLGSYLDRKPGFYNVDLAGIPVDVAWDIVRPLPFPSNSVDAICHDHMLEHLRLGDGLALTEDCFRVLRPGGRIRITVPDAEAVIRNYIAGKTLVAPTPLLELQILFYEWGHRTMYDEQTLLMLLTQCGFSDAKICGFQETAIEPCPDTFPRERTLYVEASKPDA